MTLRIIHTADNRIGLASARHPEPVRARLPEGTVASWPANPEALAEILTYHVVTGKVMAADIVGLSSAANVQGDALAISASNGVVRINDATVVATDVEALNGVIHVFDTVLNPSAD